MVKYLFLIVTATAALPAWCAQDVFLEAQLEPAQVYVQSQAVYRLRLYRAIDVRDLLLAGPSSRVADLRPIGADRVYEAVRDGQRYRVQERSYAVFPFASGALELAGAHASGRVAAPGMQSSDGRRPMRVDASPQTLTVLPAAPGIDAWLPAHALTLSETWSPAPAGALRRTVRIEASGVDASQLPEPHFAAPGIVVRAEAARLENRFVDERNIGVREQSFIVARSGVGNATVPAIDVPWWHTGTNTPMTASLPSRTLSGAAPVEAPSGPSAVPTRAPFRLAWLPAGAALLGATLFFLYRRRDAWHLYRACRRGDARTVRDGLLAWSATVWTDTPPRTLAALADRLHAPAARQAVADIDRSLYGPGGSTPDATTLCAAVRQVKSDARHTAGIMRRASRQIVFRQ